MTKKKKALTKEHMAKMQKAKEEQAVTRPHIHLIEGYYLTSDPYQWMLMKQMNAKSPRAVGYYTYPAQAMRSLVNMLLREHDCTTMAALREKAKELHSELLEVLIEAEAIKQYIDRTARADP